MTWRVGMEDAWYEAPPEGICPCSEGGLIECYCHSEVTFQDARDWLSERGIDVETRYADEVVAAIEEAHPDGYEGFHDDVAAEKASRRLARAAAADALFGKAAA